jgi:hypothetical protein
MPDGRSGSTPGKDKPRHETAKRRGQKGLLAAATYGKGHFLNDGFSEWQGLIWRGCSEPGLRTLLWEARL